MPIFRLYVDESGDHHYPANPTDSSRYLGLCGVAVESGEYVNSLVPRVRSMRAMVTTDPDFPPAIHREDIVRRKRQFVQLQDETLRKQFDNECLALFTEVDFTIFCVVIDKTAHQQQYHDPEHPYHYCFTCLLERYARFLLGKGAQGDVLVESRGKREDRTISAVFEKFYRTGSAYCRYQDAQSTLTSGSVKLAGKQALIPGLELADLLAHGARSDVLYSYQRMPALPSGFSGQVISAVQSKVSRSLWGSSRGVGKKLL